MSLDKTSKRVIIASIVVIISCFLPWWALFCEYIPSSGGNSYLIFISNPFLDSFIKFFYYGPDVNITLAFVLGFYASDATGSIVLLIATIITLVGGAIGIISLGNKKIALIGAGLVLAGVLMYIISLAVGQYPGLVDPSYFSNNGLNALFDTHVRNYLGDKASDTLGISIGPILAGIAGLIMLIYGFKSKKYKY